MSETNSTVAISKDDLKTANFNKIFTGIETKQFIHNCELALFQAIRKNLYHCIESGDILDVDIQITCKPKTIVSGTYTCDMNVPQSETDKITLELVENAFKASDKSAEARKQKFKEALEMLSN
jgi:hypothetical protein